MNKHSVRSFHLEKNKGINKLKKGYQPRAYVIKKHDSTIVANTTSMISRWEKFFSNLLNVEVLATKGVKYTLHIQTSQSLVL